MLKRVLKELRAHAPFTMFGVAGGILIMILCSELPRELSYGVFYTLHPTHVFMSALVTAAMYELHECPRIGADCAKFKCNLWKLLVIGYVGSVGIATLSDSIIPYLFEELLDMPNKGIHIGFIEKWWLVNPLAVAGIVVAHVRPATKFPHAMHVLLSTWTSLFHILMARGASMSVETYIMAAFGLFVAVWIPCCVSDIVFPMMFVRDKETVTAGVAADEEKGKVL